MAGVNVPHKASDANLLERWGESANVVSGMVSMGFAFATALSFAVPVNYVLAQSARAPHT